MNKVPGRKTNIISTHSAHCERLHYEVTRARTHIQANDPHFSNEV
jgi:hypothetical protein